MHMAIEAFFLAILVMVFILSNTHKCRDHVSYYDSGDYEQLRERERESFTIHPRSTVNNDFFLNFC
jgi:hypothetical protein